MGVGHNAPAGTHPIHVGGSLGLESWPLPPEAGQGPPWLWGLVSRAALSSETPALFLSWAGAGRRPGLWVLQAPAGFWGASSSVGPGAGCSGDPQPLPLTPARASFWLLTPSAWLAHGSLPVTSINAGIRVQERVVRMDARPEKARGSERGPQQACLTSSVSTHSPHQDRYSGRADAGRGWGPRRGLGAPGRGEHRAGDPWAQNMGHPGYFFLSLRGGLRDSWLGGLGPGLGPKEAGSHLRVLDASLRLLTPQALWGHGRFLAGLCGKPWSQGRAGM